MKVLYRTELFKKKPSMAVKDLAKVGIHDLAMDIRGVCPSEELAFRSLASKKKKIDEILLSAEPSRLSELAADYISFCKKNEMVNSVALAPSIKAEHRADKKYENADELLDELIKGSIVLAGENGCKTLIVEAEEVCARNFRTYGRMAIETNLQILIKNVAGFYNGHYIRSYWSDADQLARIVDELNHEFDREVFGICFDIAEANLSTENMYDFITTLSKRIKAVIMTDNSGVFPSRQLPFTTIKSGSNTDWLNIIRGLRTVDFDGLMIMDFADSLNAIPIQLRSNYLTFAKEMADYLLWQLSMERMIKKYDKRVLFGAGNMCRAYMKCYGEEYPPLFTCDNNESLWGTKFEGLEIKNPEGLKKLPRNCAIFICNLYYDEIASQLHAMGISNPIEYFNDEYMPSFHFTRIDAETRKTL